MHTIDEVYAAVKLGVTIIVSMQTLCTLGILFVIGGKE